MVHHRALGAAGGSRGEYDVGDVSAAHRKLERLTAGKEFGLQVDDRYSRGRGVVLTQESLLHQDGLRVAAADDVARFVRLEPRIDGHEHTARGEQPEGRNYPLGRV